MTSSAIIFGGRSPTALVLCKQLAGIGHKVHLITRVKDEEMIRLAKENNCLEVHQCDLEDLSKSTGLVQKIDNESNELSAVAFSIDIEVKLLILLNNLLLKLIHLMKSLSNFQSKLGQDNAQSF